MEDYQATLDATPSKGVIVVEYYWQAPSESKPSTKRTTSDAGAKSSMAFFRRIRAADECWCGSGRRFARCHRREEDWTYVTIDPDRRAYSPVVLLERKFSLSNSAKSRKILETVQGLLPIERSESTAVWGVPIEPTLVNEIGQLILGTMGVSPQQVHLETNSEKRFGYLLGRVKELLGEAVGEGATIRAEPQQAFRRSKRKKRGKGPAR